METEPSRTAQETEPSRTAQETEPTRTAHAETTSTTATKTSGSIVCATCYSKDYIRSDSRNNSNARSSCGSSRGSRRSSKSSSGSRSQGVVVVEVVAKRLFSYSAAYSKFCFGAELCPVWEKVFFVVRFCDQNYPRTTEIKM